MNLIFLRHIAACAIPVFFALQSPYVHARDAILIGQSAPLSGPAELLGKEMKAGAEAYFSFVNQNGGVNGRKTKLIPWTTATSPIAPRSIRKN